jgi:hypothetical protein
MKKFFIGLCLLASTHTFGCSSQTASINVPEVPRVHGVIAYKPDKTIERIFRTKEGAMAYISTRIEIVTITSMRKLSWRTEVLTASDLIPRIARGAIWNKQN